MPEQSFRCAILFADIARSTQLYEIIGDKSASNLITSCLSCLLSIAKKHTGSLIKTIGDEIMCTFPNADFAVEAAKEMHQALELIHPLDGSDFAGPLNISVGINFGTVVSDREDVYGDAVNLAARLVRIAKERQTLITEHTKNILKPELLSLTRYIDNTVIKGKTGEFKIYECVWEEENVTVSLTKIQKFQAIQAHLKLQFRKSTITIDDKRPVVTMGRLKHNDLILGYKRISRSHACIECHKGKFTLTDISSNGTHIQIEDEEDVLLKRDNISLHGSGIISLGRKASPGSPGAIHFKIEDEALHLMPGN